MGESDHEEDRIDDTILTMRARRMLDNFNEWTQEDEEEVEVKQAERYKTRNSNGKGFLQPIQQKTWRKKSDKSKWTGPRPSNRKMQLEGERLRFSPKKEIMELKTVASIAKQNQGIAVFGARC